jgi:hypothetical protein
MRKKRRICREMRARAKIEAKKLSAISKVKSIS